MCDNKCTKTCYSYDDDFMHGIKSIPGSNYLTTYTVDYPSTELATTSTEKQMWLSGDFNLNGKKIYIKEVIYNNPATIVLWNDGTKTVSKCMKGDKYSKETGLSICILKKLVGGAKVHDVFADWVDDTAKRVTLKDVRRKNK